MKNLAVFLVPLATAGGEVHEEQLTERTRHLKVADVLLLPRGPPACGPE